MNHEAIAFIEYWDVVDATMGRFFGITSAEAGIDAALIAEAQEQGWTPEELAFWYGNKHDLDYLDTSAIVSYDTI
jgi:hypothetical protein